jgi:hypothetical protein
MRKLFLLFTFLASLQIYAQNKTLGVGTNTPNSNAALDVVSPTNNQGLLMPRLTTAQRISMALGPADIGLLVYDLTTNSVQTWDGTAWSDASVTNKIALPYADTVANAPLNTNLFRIVNTGTVAGGVGVAHFENLNVNSNFTTLFVRNAGTNSAGYFQMLTNTAPSAALRGITNSNVTNGHGVLGVTSGTGGSAGYFQINNASSLKYAITGTSNGGALGAGVFGENTGTGFGIFGKSNGTVLGSAAVYGEQTGTGDAAGAFRITNATSTYSALYGETNGSGPAVFGTQLGTGRAGQFQINNAANTNAAVRGFTDGTGNAGFFTINNAANSLSGIYSTTNGTGSSILAENTGTGMGIDIAMPNVSSTANGLNIIQSGNGYSIYSKSTGTNENAWFEVANAASSGSPVVGITSGTGTAGFFQVTNATSGTTAVFGTTNSNVGGATSPGGVVGISTGTGSVGGAFRVNNVSSTFPAIYAQTNGTGNSLVLNHLGASGNISVFQNNSLNVARIDKTGQGFFNGGTVNSGADVAEVFEVEGSVKEYEPGDVLVISETTDRTVEKSSSANSRKVVGVYATKPGVLLTEKGIDDSLGNTVPMGVIGVIPTKVCLENGVIRRGDLLVSSSEKGKAMKAVPAIVNGIEIYPQGALIGKALENFEGSGNGLINVLVNVK